MPSTKVLTPLQLRFVDHYMTNGGNATQAYRDAGYTASNEQTANTGGSKLVRSAKISGEIARRKAGELKRQASRAERVNVSEDWLVTQYLDTITGAKQDGQWSTVKGCIDSIGKLTGFMVDRKELRLDGQVDHQLRTMETGELLEALQSVRADTIEGEFRKLGDGS